ncbi:hypothetical protein DFP73DRAFT_543795 [Morchella snyderi]|nr:hypothetical protein DFP73DRAFT_543795 [Morchella snyderi]
MATAPSIPSLMLSPAVMSPCVCVFGAQTITRSVSATLTHPDLRVRGKGVNDIDVLSILWERVCRTAVVVSGAVQDGAVHPVETCVGPGHGHGTGNLSRADHEDRTGSPRASP